MYQIGSLIYNHIEYFLLLYFLMTVLWHCFCPQKINLVFQRIVVLLWLIATAIITFFGRTPVMEVRINLIPFQGESFISNIKNNALLFLPWVTMVCGAIPKLKVKTAFIYGCCASLVIEIVQLISHRGICDIDDFIENVIGVALGAVIYFLINKLSRKRKV